ncbi:tyrosine-type recombinase/integrase [Lysinibacillus sp. 54212]|uniref:tyrosine-type recombinase/integrase n=1 Tax=Lysinibacillus sp. 54212 TaxID=3119829 RepID=UPI002FC66DCE
MARVKMTKIKLDSVYWYKQNGKKKFAYRYKFYDKFGKPREKSKQGFDSIEKAERALIELKANVLDGNESFVENDNITVQQLHELYIQSTRATWKPTSERNHCFVMENYILPNIGQYKAKNINNIIIQNEVFNELIEKEFKTGSLMSIYQRLNAVFSFAVKNELLPRKKFTTPNLKSAKESVKRHAFSIEEMEFILETLRTKYKITHYTTVALLFLTGMRIGELRALTWSDIDFNESVIHINKTKDRYGARNPKTTNSYREFPMNNSIIQLLTNYKEWHDDKMKSYSFRNPDNHVFVNYAGNPIGENFLIRILNLLCEREGLPYFTPHYLRHTFVTIQLLNNVPVTTVATLIGDTPDTVHKVYAHSLPKNERDASLKMDELINLESFDL